MLRTPIAAVTPMHPSISDIMRRSVVDVVGTLKCGAAAEYLDELLFVGDDVALHHVHARTEQSLERRHVQHCTTTDSPLPGGGV